MNLYEDGMSGAAIEHWHMLNVNVSRAENGFILRVDYPHEMLPKPPSAMDGVLKGLEKLTSGNMNPEEFLAGMTQDLKSSERAKHATPIRKAHETYVFASMEPLIKFLKELFGEPR